jgi:hypothetical protein
MMKKMMTTTMIHRVISQQEILIHRLPFIQIFGRNQHRRLHRSDGPPKTSHDGKKEHKDQEQISRLYLHIGPAGDIWTGDSIFAAKHLQPDYVKSLALFLPDDNDLTIDDIEKELTIFRQHEKLVEILEDDVDLALELYDNECFPKLLIDELHRRIVNNDNEDDDDVHD